MNDGLFRWKSGKKTRKMKRRKEKKEVEVWGIN